MKINKPNEINVFLQRFIEGFIIRYRALEGDAVGNNVTAPPPLVAPPQPPTALPLASVSAAAGARAVMFSSEERVDDGLATSHVLKRLAKFTQYELVVAPYYRTVVGVDSLPGRARTFEDGFDFFLHNFSFL